MARCTSIHVSIPSSERAVSVEDLEARLRAIDTQFAAVTVDFGSFPSPCALVNGPHGWLTFFRHDGDAGFSSRAPDYTGPDDLTYDYVLGNGQLDCYPAS